MCVMPRPVPSIETNRSIWPFMPSFNRYFTPRRSPSPSSPTVPTNVIDPGVWIFAWFMARITGEHHREAAAIVANARTAKDGAFALHLHVGALGKDGVEVRGEHESRARLPARAIAEHVADFVDAHVLQAGLAKHPRVDLGALGSLNGGASISQMRTWSSMVCGSAVVIASTAALIAGSARSFAPTSAASC